MTTAIESAIADPVGCRHAWMEWGQTIGYQAQQYGPLKLGAGKGEWQRTISSAPATLLGLAWQALEERENHHTAQEPEWHEAQNKNEKGKDMPVIEYREIQTIEPGYYPAQVKSIEEATGEYGPQLKFVFSILGPDNRPRAKDSGDPLEQWAWCSMKWGPRTKLLEWAKVLLKAKCPPPGEPIDTDLLIGKRCDIEIVERETPNGMRTRIDRIMPFRSMSQSEDDQ